MAKAELAKTITDEEKYELIDTVIVKTQGFVNGNIDGHTPDPVQLFRELLSRYEGIDRHQLRDNLCYFLSAIMSVCDACGVDMCIHPDDPPYQMLGLPRIVTSGEDIDWLLKAVDNPHNGLTFCAGSLSAGLQNDVVELAVALPHVLVSCIYVVQMSWKMEISWKRPIWKGADACLSWLLFTKRICPMCLCVSTMAG